MSGKVLVTGGCGFIGSWTVDLLIEKGYDVVVLDNLEWQVHRGRMPEWINPKACYVFGDLRDYRLLREIISDVDYVIHLAALVGIGQSMYEVERYTDVNVRGTAALLESIINSNSDVKKVVVASSMNVYGEGKYYCETCGEYKVVQSRSLEQLRKRIWNPLCPDCGQELKPVPTDENKSLNPLSIYAWTKLAQEQLSMIIGRAYGIPVVVLRYFNVYGPRQSLSNPYAGVCAIFICRLLNGKPPYIFEDGGQLRDFVYVKDVAEANILALERRACDYQVINIGTSKPISILRLAKEITAILKVDIEPHVTYKYRKGDIRHCFADISKAEKLLDWRPRTAIREGLRRLIEWALKGKWELMDRFDKVYEEMERKGILI